MSDFYVEFDILNDGQFEKLSVAFFALLDAKSKDDWEDDAFWLSFFDAEARLHFRWDTDEEKRERARRWSATPVAKRGVDRSLDFKWDIGSLIDAFQNGDYALISCDRTSPSSGRLYFDPYGWPYGGTGCMRALIESFGHRVTALKE